MNYGKSNYAQLDTTESGWYFDVKIDPWQMRLDREANEFMRGWDWDDIYLFWEMRLASISTAIRGATEEEAVAYSIGVEVSDGNGDEPFLMFNEV